MKPQDVIEQLVGTFDRRECTDYSIDCVQLERTSKFPHGPVAIDFESGKVSIYELNGETIINEFAIRATLEPITE